MTEAEYDVYMAEIEDASTTEELRRYAMQFLNLAYEHGKPADPFAMAEAIVDQDRFYTIKAAASEGLALDASADADEFTRELCDYFGALAWQP